MPELPEVETIVRTLIPRLTARRVLAAAFHAPRVLRGAPPPNLIDQVIRQVRRHGKHILLDFDHGTLAIHLGMTGKLLFNTPPNPHLRASIVLEDATLQFEDIRQFGQMAWNKNLENQGPDPLEVSGPEFRARLKGRKVPIKTLLLNQTFLRGVGNIYADEALFEAGIHPRTPAGKIGRTRAERLLEALRQILKSAIRQGGSSISDYVDAEGARGAYQQNHQVYGREDEPCPRCQAPIKRLVLAQRSAHFCPRCQRF